MELDVLNVSSGVSQTGDAITKLTINLTVVPTSTSELKVGDSVFTSRFVKPSEGENRINARAIISSDEHYVDFVKEMIPSVNITKKGLAGFAKVWFSPKGQPADLVFFLFTCLEEISRLRVIISQAEPGDLSLYIDTTAFKAEATGDLIISHPEDTNVSYLPIDSWSLSIRHMTSNRVEIADRKGDISDKQALDSDDLDAIKRTARRMKQGQDASPDPLLRQMRDIRAGIYTLAALAFAALLFAVNRWG
jgi:hypothetical protein